MASILGKRRAEDGVSEPLTKEPPTINYDGPGPGMALHAEPTDWIESEYHYPTGFSDNNEAMHSAERSRFTLGGLHDTIDLDKHYLRDLLTDTPVSEPIATVTTGLYHDRTKSKSGGRDALVVPEVSEWDKWEI